jgi:hypothetical protein
MILIFGLAAARAGQLAVERPDIRRRLAGLCALPAFIYLGFAVAFVAFGASPALLKSLLGSVAFVLPAFVFAVDTAVSCREKDLFQRFERWTLVLLPAAVQYVLMGISGANLSANGIDLGQLDYLSLAYTYVPCLFVLSISFLFKPFGEDAAFGGVIRGPAADIARLCLMALFWILIVLSATRGPQLSVVGFFLLLLLSRAVRRKPVAKILAVVAGMVAIFLILNAAISTPGMAMARQRWGIVLDGLKQGRLTAEVESKLIEQNLDALVKSPGGKNFKKYALEHGSALAVLADKEGIRVRISNRGTLYALALREFLKSPVTGMLPLGYFVKYDNYPHNAVLEILSELGLLGFIPVMVVFWLLGWKLAKASSRDIMKEAMFILVLGLLLKCMVSGTIWEEGNLMFACAYAAAFGKGFFKA